MRFYTTGHFYDHTPEDLRRLPLDLLRSHMVTHDPAVIQAGIEQYQTGELPVFYAPQKMGMQKWRREAFANVAWGQNVVSMLGAMRQRMQVESDANAKARSIPTMDFVQAGQADGRARLPQPTDRLSPHMAADYHPIARGVGPLDRYTDPATVQHASDTDFQDMTGDHARKSAMASMEQARDAMVDFTDNTVNMPWFVFGR